MSENNTIIFQRGKNFDGSSGGESSSEPNDIWDDTLLIEAYDRAVKIAHEACLEKQNVANNFTNKNGKKKNDNKKWKVGDRCRCQYSEDLNYYEADIIDIAESEGVCTVKYIGYDNKEAVPLKSLKLSKGDSARLQQIQDAAADTKFIEDYNLTNVSREESWCSNNQYQNKTKKLSSKKKGESKEKLIFPENAQSPLNFSPQGFGSIIPPPPPPPHMFKNLNEDSDETEAMSAMLISWYMSGYHTGYYQGLKMAKKQKY